MRSQLYQGATHGDLVPEHLARDRTGGDATGRLTRGRPAAAAPVPDAVLLPVGEIRVSRPILVLDVAVILGARVEILDHQIDRRSGRLAVEHAGHDLDRIGFPALTHIATLAGTASIQPVLDVGLGQGEPGRDPVDHAADGRPMALTPSGDTEQMTEGVVGHEIKVSWGSRRRGWLLNRRRANAGHRNRSQPFPVPWTTEMSGASTAFIPTTW